MPIMVDEDCVETPSKSEPDIYSQSKLVYGASKVLGMAPVSVNTSGGRRHVHFSTLAFLHSLAVLLAITPVTLLGLAQDLFHFSSGMKTVRMKNMTSVVVTFCDVVSVMVTAAVGVLFSSIKHGQIALLIRQIYDVDTYLCIKLPETSSDSFVRVQRARKHTMYLTIGLFLHLLVMFLFDLWVWYSVTGHVPYSYLPVYGLYLLVGILELQFVHLVWNLHQRFKHFNEQLMRIAVVRRTATDEAPSPGAIIKHFSSQRSIVFRRRRVADSLEGQSSRVSSSMKGSGSSHSTELQLQKQQLFRLECLCNLHAELCEIVTTVNSAYGFQILVHILSLFLHLIITPYFFLLDLLYPVTYGATDPSFLVLQLTWIITHMAKLFLIVQPCSATYDEASRTGILVSNLLNGNFNTNLKKQLEIFALQLVHRRVKFSACGFYSLDFPLIASIAGSVTTYLVILIQFQNSDSVTK